MKKKCMLLHCELNVDYAVAVTNDEHDDANSCDSGAGIVMIVNKLLMW